jgi:DNA ligase (NAD+)
MIIPQIASNITMSDSIEIPNKCPACNHEAVIKKINGIDYLYCTNEYCHAKFIKKLSLFTSRNAMNIDGISDAILSVLFKEGFVSDYKDLYHLDRYKEEIVNYNGFGLKSYENLVNSIEKSRNVKLANFIYALGIPEIGFSRAKLIAKRFNYDFEKVRNASLEEISSIDGLGDIIAQKWIETFHNDDFIKSLDRIIPELKFIDSKNTSDKLSNKVFVITGTLEKYENRDALIEYIESLGGKVISAVSSKVDYLINNDVSSNSTKNKKAKELNIPIISEEEFEKML